MNVLVPGVKDVTGMIIECIIAVVDAVRNDHPSEAANVVAPLTAKLMNWRAAPVAAIDAVRVTSADVPVTIVTEGPTVARST